MVTWIVSDAWEEGGRVSYYPKICWRNCGKSQKFKNRRSGSKPGPHATKLNHEVYSFGEG